MPTSKKRPQSTRREPRGSGNPAAGPEARYSPTSWGSDNTGLTDLECPSGQLALVRRPGVDGLLRAGVLHNVDVLTQMVKSKHIDPKDPKAPPTEISKEDVSKILEDPVHLENVLHTVDRVVCHVVVQPSVHMAPNDVTSRVPGTVYTDMIDLEDKVFILNWALGGSRDLERFRRESQESVGDVDASADLPHDAEPAA